MKSFIFLFYSVLAFSSVAEKNITLQFVEIQSNKGIEGLELELWYGRTKISNLITDSLGRCVLEDLNRSNYELYIQNMHDVYENRELIIYNTSWAGSEQTIKLRWSANREEEMLAAAKLRDAPLFKEADEKQKAAEEKKALGGDVDSLEVYSDSEDEDTNFPGGVAALQNFVEETLRYPESAMGRGERGRIYLTFVVEVDGSIVMAQIERGISPALDKEAMLILLYMPNWIPGKTRGEPTRTKVRLPINFTLN